MCEILKLELMHVKLQSINKVRLAIYVYFVPDLLVATINLIKYYYKKGFADYRFTSIYY